MLETYELVLVRGSVASDSVQNRMLGKPAVTALPVSVRLLLLQFY